MDHRTACIMPMLSLYSFSSTVSYEEQIPSFFIPTDRPSISFSRDLDCYRKFQGFIVLESTYVSFVSPPERYDAVKSVWKVM